MNYPELDLSRMFELPRCAVRVRTPEDAETLIANFRNQYPGKAKYFRMDDTGWDEYEEDTAYTLYYPDEDDHGTLSRTEYDWFEEQGYEIIEFSALLDTAEIEESDMPLESLFGAIKTEV